MKHLKIVGYALAFALSIISCNRDNENLDTIIPESGFRNGILVANEGNFGRPNADISYISSDLSQIDNNLYNTTNGESLGDVLQDVGFSGNNAYFVMNNSNKIVVTDRYTFSKKAEITEGINQPRYITFANNYIYISNTPDFSDATKGYVSVYNSKDYSFVKKIEVFNTTERLESIGNYVFVQNASWGSGKNITQINTQSNEIVDVISLNENIVKILTYNNSLYVMTNGSSDSYVYQYDSEGEWVKTITILGISNAKNINIDNNIIYFTAGTKAYSLPISGGTPNTLFEVEDTLWYNFYSFNVINGLIYTSDAKYFSQNSEINIYTTSGTLIKTLTAGIGTNAFYKN